MGALLYKPGLCCSRARLSDSSAKIGSSNGQCQMAGFLGCILLAEARAFVSQ